MNLQFGPKMCCVHHQFFLANVQHCVYASRGGSEAMPPYGAANITEKRNVKFCAKFAEFKPSFVAAKVQYSRIVHEMCKLWVRRGAVSHGNVNPEGQKT